MTQVSFKEGDIFQSGCDVLVNPVNCVGIAGAGLALAFKKRYAGTGMMAFYQRVCEIGQFKPGSRPVIWRAPREFADADMPNALMPSVLLFPIEESNINIDNIRSSLLSIQGMNFKGMSCAIPKVSFGFDDVSYHNDLRPIFCEILPFLSFNFVEVYE